MSKTDVPEGQFKHSMMNPQFGKSERYVFFSCSC